MIDTSATTLERLAWAPQMKLRNGSIGHHHGACPITGKHRVFIEGRGAPNPGGPTGTTYLLDDAGCARGDCSESPFDAIGPA